MESILPVLIIVLLAALYFWVRSASFKGAVGEKRVNATLRTLLNSKEYQLLTDITLPTRDGSTQIDQVIVSKYGIFIVETKNMSGWIFGSADQSTWTQVIFKKKTRFQNPLRQNYRHLKAVQDILSVRMSELFNVVAFVGSAKPKTDMPPNVVWGMLSLANYIKSKRSPVFTDSEIAAFVDRMTNHAFEKSRKTKRDHVKYVKAKARARRQNTGRCPRCSSEMVRRTNRQTGETFLGCSQYPKCKGTREVT